MDASPGKCGYSFLETLGIPTTARSASIGRVDYAIDVLAPGFQLVPDNFVMHSRAVRADHREGLPVVEHGRSGRVTSVTVGKMPNRQIIVYDKRAEVIESRKVEWWEIWNATLRAASRSDLDPYDREASQVWRVELRAGKRHLKDRWGVRDWLDLDTKIGDLFRRAVADVRYTWPAPDLNRARWQHHPLWKIVQTEVAGDLLEMASGASPGTVREVRRKDLEDLLMGQIIGLAANLPHVRGMSRSSVPTIGRYVAHRIQEYARCNPVAFGAKQQRAAERYCLF